MEEVLGRPQEFGLVCLTFVRIQAGTFGRKDSFQAAVSAFLRDPSPT